LDDPALVELLANAACDPLHDLVGEVGFEKLIKQSTHGLSPPSALKYLREAILSRIQKSKQPGTKTTYASALKLYLKTAIAAPFKAFPITEGKLAIFASLAHDKFKLRATSIPTYVSGVVHFARLQGQDSQGKQATRLR
jgi:hypothetical protein